MSLHLLVEVLSAESQASYASSKAFSLKCMSVHCSRVAISNFRFRFMQSDPMWSLAMAVNVYLVFFRRYDASRLKKLYWLYGIICYGVPFIPAMVCLLLRVKGRRWIYGNATVG